jgi:hypothetical protein
MFMRIAIAAAILLILCASARTQDFSAYKCTIKETMQLGKERPEPKPPPLAAAYRNAELVIDRKSGKMVGSPPLGGFGTGTQSSVWHPGSSGAAFKAVYTSGEPPIILYLLTLQILENVQGAVKPFLLTEVGDIVNMHFGTCTHLD